MSVINGTLSAQVTGNQGTFYCLIAFCQFIINEYVMLCYDGKQLTVSRQSGRRCRRPVDECSYERCRQCYCG